MVSGSAASVRRHLYLRLNADILVININSSPLASLCAEVCLAQGCILDTAACGWSRGPMHKDVFASCLACASG